MAGGALQCSFSLFQKNFRMLVLCLTFPKAFMMTGNVVGRRLTMNWSYGSVGSARAAAKKAPSSARRWNAACSDRKRPPSARYTARTAAGSLQFCFLRRVFVCGTEIRKRSGPGFFGRERFCGQKRRESQRRALASQPLMPSEAIPRIRCFWRKRNRISSGRQVTTTPAIVRFNRLK